MEGKKKPRESSMSLPAGFFPPFFMTWIRGWCVSLTKVKHFDSEICVRRERFESQIAGELGLDLLLVMIKISRKSFLISFVKVEEKTLFHKLAKLPINFHRGDKLEHLWAISGQSLKKEHTILMNCRRIDDVWWWEMKTSASTMRREKLSCAQNKSKIPLKNVSPHATTSASPLNPSVCLFVCCMDGRVNHHKCLFCFLRLTVSLEDFWSSITPAPTVGFCLVSLDD